MDSHNVTANTSILTSNTQRENKNAILTIDKLDKLDELEELLKDLTINYTGYYVSDSANTNDKKVNPERDPKTVTHTNDKNKIKVADTSNGILQQNLLSNRIFPVVTTKMDPRTEDRIVTCEGTPHTSAISKTKEVITDAERSSVRVKRNHRHVSWTVRDSSTPTDTCIDIRSSRANSPVMIGSTTVSLVCGISERLKVGNKQQSTPAEKIRNAQKLDTDLDRNFPNDWDSATIFSKVIGRELSHVLCYDL